MGGYSIAIATSVSPLPPSDQALIAALENAGANAIPVLWDSPDIDWRAFDCVVVRSCWDYHLRLPEFLAWLDEASSDDDQLPETDQMERR